ncbi:Uncharacterized protein dnm_034690 [Desulfonema magnum]|uniref:Uncharacterized protein n=1 Tax=Desulfonema magnum TaxID=45655 RepID=A0A975GN59_9BACT|nr:Uncharacterized protein dnm_034690 [Desulfonema magnum]
MRQFFRKIRSSVFSSQPLINYADKFSAGFHIPPLKTYLVGQ